MMEKIDIKRRKPFRVIRGIRTLNIRCHKPALHQLSYDHQSGLQDSNLRDLAPKASGRPLSQTQRCR